METVIALAPNLFYGTTIAVNIMVLSKHKTDTKIQFIDASGEEFYKKETNNNVLTEEHIEKIMQLFAGKEDKEYIAKSVDKDKIAEENYNLSVSIYVEIKDTRETIDIKALNAEIKNSKKYRQTSFRNKKFSYRENLGNCYGWKKVFNKAINFRIWATGILKEYMRRITRSSAENRAKESLIVDFINQTALDEIQDKASVRDASYQFAQREQKKEAEELIREEQINEDAAKRYILTSLKKEYASENGTGLNEALPKMSPLNPKYHTKKQNVFKKISAFVEKFKRIGGAI